MVAVAGAGTLQEILCASGGMVDTHALGACALVAWRFKSSLAHQIRRKTFFKSELTSSPIELTFLYHFGTILVL